MFNPMADWKRTETDSKLSAPIFIILRDRIVYLDYPPNHVLTEKGMCQEFGVSRTPLREAILKLEQMHLVKSVPRLGTVVTPIDTREIKDTYKVKANLEAMAAREAARRISDRECTALEQISAENIKAAEASDVRAMFDTDIRFHEAIWRITGNLVLFDLLEDLHARCLRFCIAANPSDHWGMEHAVEIKDICSAVAGRDEDRAAELLRAHNLQFLKMIKDFMFD